MKKIVTLGAIAVLSAGFMFADEPAADVSITEFKGNAKVTWGMDLDAGKTGFKNTEEANFKVNLFSKGEKVTEGEGTWAELKIKTEGLKLENGEWKEGKASVDAATLHIGNIFVGIRSGDAMVGEYKFDGAIRSADNGNAQWLSNVGPAGFSQGIVAGYADDNFDFGVDFRSYYDASTQYTNAYAFAAEAKLKDSNSFAEGLFVDLGGSFATTDIFYKKADEGSVEKAYVNEKEEWVLGYSANAGYKFKLDDKYFVKPAVGFTGSNVTSTGLGDKNSKAVNNNSLVAGVIFGWGDTADANAGVYYLDGDMAKKVTPGVSVVAAIPLPETEKGTKNDKAYSVTTNKALKALIVPSFYSGDLVENLTAAVYSEMGLLQSVKEADQSKGTDDKTINKSSTSKETFAFAVAAGAKYDIKSDAATITPQIGFRFANGAYFDNNINATSPLSSNPVFKDMGEQIYIAKKDADNEWTYGYDNFLNLKAGVNVNGLINNTDLYVVYQSANILNKTNYGEKTTIKVGGVSTEVDNPLYRKEGWYNVKLGTLTLGTKISF
jgi:hypothetical protein